MGVMREVESERQLEVLFFLEVGEKRERLAGIHSTGQPATITWPVRNQKSPS